MIERVRLVDIPAIEAAVVGDEFAAGKNGIRYIDHSFMERIREGRRIPAQQQKRLAYSRLRDDATSEQILREIGEHKRAKVGLGDLLAIIRSGELDHDTRVICLLGRCAIRVDRTTKGYALHAFSLKAPGQWHAGRWVVMPVQ